MGLRFRVYITAFLPAALWLVVIMIFSNTWASASYTWKIIVLVLRVLHLPVNVEWVALLNHIARTTAHLLLYSVFAVLVWRGFQRLPEPPRLTSARLLAVVLLIVATCAAGDELHQWTLAARSGTVRDVFLDAAGGAMGLMAGWIYRRRSAAPQRAPAFTARKS